MNLLTEPWLPVRKRDGTREWIGPSRLSDPDFVAFDADRADFNGALAQFAIGLLQTTTPVDSPIEWRRLFNNPPDAATLQSWFAPVTSAFEFDGDGARFMQDKRLRATKQRNEEVGNLLIEAPGENALGENRDHFVKRGHVGAVCPHCAATALIALQINASEGGRGYPPGLRGGGPLTTLVIAEVRTTLWNDLWLNVQERSRFLAGHVDGDRTDYGRVFPWIRTTETQQEESHEVTPAHMHPLHVFWAVPRRIYLNFEDRSKGKCAICGRQFEKLLCAYAITSQGPKFRKWIHPLSPYYLKDEDWLPVHPKPGGLGYRHWLAWILARDHQSDRRPATVVNHALSSRRGRWRVWAFGYSMKKDKVRVWTESTLPLYGLADCDLEAQKIVEAEVANWLAAATLAANYLHGAVRDAWFGGNARGDLGVVDTAFWSRTEPQFYTQLRAIIESARDDAAPNPLPIREAWLKHLANAAMQLFDDDFVGAGPVERQNPKRVAAAFQQLKRSLYGSKMRQALGLPDNEEFKSKRRGAKRSATA